MKLLIDEMFPPVVAELLRERGHDVVAVLERPDLAGLSDADLLGHAAREGRAVVTENVRDFALLDRRYRQEGREHEGLVYVLKGGQSARRRVHDAARRRVQAVQ